MKKHLKNIRKKKNLEADRGKRYVASMRQIGCFCTACDELIKTMLHHADNEMKLNVG